MLFMVKIFGLVHLAAAFTLPPFVTGGAMDAVQTLVAIAITALFAWLIAQVRRGVKNKALADGLAALVQLAGIVVGNIQQRVVSDLRDSSKPGSWTTTAAAAARNAAIDDLRTLGASVFPRLIAAGMHPDHVRELVPLAIESAVADLKAKNGAVQSIEPIAGSLNPTPAPVVVPMPVAPVEGSAR